MLKIIWEHYLFQNYPRERCYFALVVYSDLLIIFIVCARFPRRSTGHRRNRSLIHL